MGKYCCACGMRMVRRRRSVTDHVVAGTGYKVNVNRLAFLSEELRTPDSDLSRFAGVVEKVRSFSARIVFVGLSAANSFGPGDAIYIRRGLCGAQLDANGDERGGSRHAISPATRSVQVEEVHR